MTPFVFPPPDFADHALLDSGGGEKLERYGPVVLRRPDPQALWRKRLGASEWERADLAFARESDRGGRWEARAGAHPAARGEKPEWPVRFGRARFLVRPTPFKHVGLFPEQAANWLCFERTRAQFGAATPELLDLFGYTGAASVFAALAGWKVTHVDASRLSLAWMRDNLRASELAEDAVRVLLDDALAFARREARRGSRYHAVLLDPPAYGRGPKGEVWRLEEGLAPLIEAVAALLAERSFLVLSTYAVGYSPLAFANLLGELEGGAVEAGELALREEEREGFPSRLLPCGFCARWSRGVELSA